MTKQHHFFATTAYAWRTHADLYTALQRLHKSGGMSGNAKGAAYAVYKVPLPETAHYEIDFYAPQVEGTELIATGTFR